MQRWLLLILYGALLVPGSMASELPNLPERPGNEYGIEPDKLYPGSLVLQILEAVEEEVDSSIRSAHAEGYKAGRMEAAELWKPILLSERDRADRAQRAKEQVERKVLYGILAGLVGGFFSSWATIWAMGR